jgi:hypothetical protein
MKEDRQIELVLAKELLKRPLDREIKTQKTHPLGVWCVHRYPQRLHASGLSLAIHAAARDTHDFVPLRAQLAQHLHPLQVRPVTIRMRQHFVYHQNVQWPLGSTIAAVAMLFCCVPFIHRDCHRDIFSGIVLQNHNAHSYALICASNQAIVLPIARTPRKW